MNNNNLVYPTKDILASGVISVKLPEVKLTAKDNIVLGSISEMLYIKDLLTATESPNMGCSVMEVENAAYNFELDHDEVNYVIEGSLTIVTKDKSVLTKSGEVCFIPKGSKGAYSAKEKVRFLSVSCAEEWK